MRPETEQEIRRHIRAINLALEREAEANGRIFTKSQKEMIRGVYNPQQEETKSESKRS